MTFSLGQLIERRRGDQYALHGQYINTSLARVALRKAVEWYRAHGYAP